MNEDLTLALSRRELMRGAGLIGAGSTLAAWPLGSLLAKAPMMAWPAVQKLMADYVDTGKLAGTVAALGFGQNAAQFLARGKQSLDAATPAGPDSLYRVYSMTKPITGMAAMILIDEGKMGLDQPLSDILPKFAKMRVQVTPDGSITDLRPAKTPITIRMLLTHSAGLGYSIIQKGAIRDAYVAAGLVPGRVTKQPIPGLGGDHNLPSLAAFADKLAEMPLVYDPGTKWSYSVALDLMGRVIEVVSGKSFDAFLQERIFGPTGMTSSWFQVPGSAAARLTSNYGVLGGTLLPLDPAKSSIFFDKPAFPYGGAGLVSSPRDYDRFLQMLIGYGKIGNARVMTERAVRIGTSNLLPATVDTSGGMVSGAGFGAGGRVGLGVDAGTYGWGGAAGTVAYINYPRGLRASFFTQYMPSDVYPIHRAFPVAVQSDLVAGAVAKAA